MKTTVKTNPPIKYIFEIGVLYIQPEYGWIVLCTSSSSSVLCGVLVCYNTEEHAKADYRKAGYSANNWGDLTSFQEFSGSILIEQ